MLSFFSGFDRLISLVSTAQNAKKVNAAFIELGYPPVVSLVEGRPHLNTSYRIDLAAPPRFVWFRLVEVYVQYLPTMKELTYNVRKNEITHIKDI